MLNYLTGNTQNGLANITHIFIDEVHERDVNIDFLLRVIKHTLVLSKVKLILMSATIDTDLFSNYFDGCFAMKIAGRTYDVEEMYLDGILKKIDPTSTANEATYNSRISSSNKEYDDDLY